MTTDSDDSFILDRTKRLTDILRSRFGATGRSLGELTNSVESRLQICVVLGLRRLSEIRNLVVKDRKPFPLRFGRDRVDREDFARLSDEIEERLTQPVAFLIVNKNSGSCVDLNNWGKGDGEVIHQWALHGKDNQRWFLQRANGDHYLILSVHSRKCIDVPLTHENLARVHQWECHGKDNQLWELTELENGLYKIVSKYSAKCLEVLGGSHENSAPIVQNEWKGGDNQQWLLQTCQGRQAERGIRLSELLRTVANV